MKFSKVLTVLVVAMFFGLALSAQSSRPLSLRECVETGLKNYLPVNQSELAMERSKVAWQQSKGDMLPTLNGNISHSYNAGRNINQANEFVNQTFTGASYSLNSDLTIFNGLRLWNRLRSSQYAYEASRLEWQIQKDNLTLDIILAYLTILNNQDQLALAGVQTAQTQQQVNRLEILNQQGAILPSDLSDLKANLANNKLAEVNAANQLEISKVTLARLMNITYDSTMQVERLPVEQFDTYYTGTPDSIYTVASQQLALARAPEMRRKSAEKTVSSMRGNLYPSIGIGGTAITRYSSDLPNTYSKQLSELYGFNVGLGVNIPILNGFFARNQVKLAKINLEEAELVEKTTLIQLRQNIDRDYVNMKASVNRYRALVEQVTALNESFAAAEARFNGGVGNSVDFLAVRNNFDRANVNLILARYDFVLRTKILDYYQGRSLW